MKAADAKRAMILVEARETLDEEWFADASKRSEPNETWAFFGMRIGLADIGLGNSDDFGGVNAEGWLDIDIETARLLVPLLRKLIDDELATLGVEG